MRIRAAVSATLASAGILLAGWQSGAHVAGTAGAAGSPSGTTGPGAGAAGPGTTGTAGGSVSSGSAGSSGAAGSAAKAGGTFAGDVVQTRFGPVQVQITVSGGTISDVTALQLTDDGGRSVQISNYAAPLLRAEVLQAQSANVQTIGGATVTSDAYLTSLQAALDAAHL
ncbi:FMN-binding protein [Arthrobacter sp. Hor0625]|uniref:FMN-binding protein n=1 Tax=Arthrobacter sp. Hor0625 TaxID=3457358 RepID=UPI00403EB1B5